ncbi:hypothetical protein TI05_11170 [Achromatium sp. WMS3]|nr:hypothetical protein TI05_11170 [Achromatium sp. WMS3]
MRPCLSYLAVYYIDVQFSITIPFNLIKWLGLFVTSTMSLAMALAPINKSKSSIGVPDFLNLAFSLANTSKALKMGRI